MKLIDLLKRKNVSIADYARVLGITYQAAILDAHKVGGPTYLKRFMDLLELVGVDAIVDAPKIVAERPVKIPKYKKNKRK